MKNTQTIYKKIF